MRTFTFKVLLTVDEDGWLVRCPGLEHYGAATWGRDVDEALRYIREVMEMVVEELLEEGKAVPVFDSKKEPVPPEYLVTVTV